MARKMTSKDRKRIERFLRTEFGRAAAKKATEKDKQGWFDYFTEMNAELARRAECYRTGKPI